MKLQVLIPPVLEYNMLDGWIKKCHVIEDENRSYSLMCKLVSGSVSQIGPCRDFASSIILASPFLILILSRRIPRGSRPSKHQLFKPSLLQDGHFLTGKKYCHRMHVRLFRAYWHPDLKSYGLSLGSILIIVKVAVTRWSQQNILAINVGSNNLILIKAVQIVSPPK